MQPAITERPAEVQAAARYFENAAHVHGVSCNFALMILERQIIQAALDRNQGNQRKAAKALGWHRNTLTRRMVELKIARARDAKELPSRRRDGLPDYRKRVIVGAGEQFPTL